LKTLKKAKKFSKREYSYNSFTRSFTLPETADSAKIEAEYVDGILKLNVAKKEEAKNSVTRNSCEIISPKVSKHWKVRKTKKKEV